MEAVREIDCHLRPFHGIPDENIASHMESSLIIEDVDPQRTKVKPKVNRLRRRGEKDGDGDCLISRTEDYDRVRMLCSYLLRRGLVSRAGKVVRNVQLQVKRVSGHPHNRLTFEGQKCRTVNQYVSAQRHFHAAMRQSFMGPFGIWLFTGGPESR